MQSLQKKLYLCFFFSPLIIFGVLGCFPLLGVHYNSTPSLPKGFYLRIQAPITKDSYVEICPPPKEPFLTAHKRNYIGTGACPHEMRYLLKKATALKGDKISMLDSGLYINGHKYPDSKPFNADPNNLPLPHWRIKNHTLKANEILLMGENPASFDARYFGLLKLSDVISVMKPLWVFK